MTLFGHDENLRILIEAARGKRLHHAWLLTGPEGVGKASFAALVAARLLAEGRGPAADDAEASTRSLIAAGSHPDFMRLERATNEKTGKLAAEISVDQVRGLSRLFTTGGTYSARRIVVIDAVDHLNRNAANALLKNLEEPPEGALFLLVSHMPGRLLPTIRSRTRLLRFARLSDDAMADAIRLARPDAGTAEIAALVAGGRGLPGGALATGTLDAAGLDRALTALSSRGDPDNRVRSQLARSLAARAAQPRYELFLARAPAHIAALARARTGPDLIAAISAWERARTIAASAIPLALEPETTAFELAGIVASLAPVGLASRHPPATA